MSGDIDKADMENHSKDDLRNEGEIRDEDLGITSVSADIQKKREAQFRMGMMIVISVILVVIYIGISNDDGEEKGLGGSIAKDFEINTRSLNFPISSIDGPSDLLISDESKSEIKESQDNQVQPTLILSNEDVESVEQRKARIKAEKLNYKRRHAPAVVFDKKVGQTSNSNRAITDNLDPEALTKSLLKSVANSSLIEGVNQRAQSQDLMSKRLQSAATVGVTASLIREKPYTIAEGKMLGCILETAIHSALPGMTRCILSENIFSYDGSQLLLEKGSRLVGQYEGGIQAGEDRIFVIWTRIITPKGVDISLNSPGTGELGRAGHGVYVDSHFFERFGASALLSIVGGLAASESDGDVRLSATADSFNQSAEIALKDSLNIRPTGQKNQGDRVKVFVARDIDFAPVLQLAAQQLAN